MAKSLTLKQLEQDKIKLTQLIKQAQSQIAQWNTKMLRFSGALDYVEDNIKGLKGEQ